MYGLHAAGLRSILRTLNNARTPKQQSESSPSALNSRFDHICNSINHDYTKVQNLYPYKRYAILKL